MGDSKTETILAPFREKVKEQVKYVQQFVKLNHNIKLLLLGLYKLSSFHTVNIQETELNWLLLAGEPQESLTLP